MAECKGCKKEIPAERLEVLPDTEVCTECSKAVGGETNMVVSLSSMGKAGSLKKNYGGVSAEFIKKKIIPLDAKTFGEMD